jgi:hypothetical protein
MAINPKSSMQRFVVWGAILVLIPLAWIGFTRIHNLMMLGYIDSAIARIRSVNSAEKAYAEAHPGIGYACILSQLPHDGQVQRLLKGGTDNGYASALVGCEPPTAKKTNRFFRVTAHPLHSELPAFCSDQSGIVSSDEGGSVEKCLVSGIPLGN